MGPPGRGVAGGLWSPHSGPQVGAESGAQPLTSMPPQSPSPLGGQHEAEGLCGSWADTCRPTHGPSVRWGPWCQSGAGLRGPWAPSWAAGGCEGARDLPGEHWGQQEAAPHPAALQEEGRAGQQGFMAVGRCLGQPSCGTPAPGSGPGNSPSGQVGSGGEGSAQPAQLPSPQIRPALDSQTGGPGAPSAAGRGTCTG